MIEIKKKFFLGTFPGPKIKFLGLINFSKIFELHLVPGTIFKKKLKNLRYYQVPNTRCSGNNSENFET
jgi:hypothetical protein